jgi:hypothetical protein
MLFQNKPIVLFIGYSKGARRRKHRKATWEMSIIKE